jgi:hypothetical protein
MGMKKISPRISCKASPVILGDSSKIKIIRRAVSKAITNFFFEDAIISLYSVHFAKFIQKIEAY